MKTKIGIPKALLYFRYHTLWESFFEKLDCEIVESEDTTKAVLSNGMNYAIDEACLSYKIYLGHLASLIGKCDYILIPRIATFADREIVCTRFQALYDVVKNTFRDQDFKILDYNVDVMEGKTEQDGFIEMGRRLGKSKKESLEAYLFAKGAMEEEQKMKLREQNKKLKTDNIKLLVVSHPYNIYDSYVGKPVSDYLEEPVEDDILSQLKLDTSTVNVQQPGEYIYTVYYKKKSFQGKVLVKEKPIPEVTIKQTITLKAISVPIGTPISQDIAYYVIEAIPDEVRNNMQLDISRVNPDQAGDYTYTITYNGAFYPGSYKVYDPNPVPQTQTNTSTQGQGVTP